MAVLCLALLGAVPAAGAGAAEPRTPPRDSGAGAGASVVGGAAASIATYPWLAYVSYAGPGSRFGCTGTVVAPRVVLTAGHCLLSDSGRMLDPKNYRIVTGLADLEEVGRQNVSLVSQALAFPGYRPAKALGDAGLLVLAAPVAAPPIPLAGPADEPLLVGGTKLLVAGWGLTNGRASSPSPVLRAGETVVQDSGYCRAKARRVTLFYDSEIQLCAISAPSFDVSSCRGDSGGPGLARRADGTLVQVGIISMGSADCRPTIPEFQTRVDRVSPWASSWIAAIEAGGPPPPVFVPPLLKLPRLGFAAAKHFAYLAFSSDFGTRFTRGTYKRIACERVEREKVKCAVFWYRGGSVYLGTITVFYSLPREGPIWNYRYAIRKVNANCWANSPEPKRCPQRTFSR